MIVAALYIRGDGSGGTGGSVLAGGDAEPAALVCVPELERVCKELAGDGIEVTIEEAGKTADRLAGTDVIEHDAWLTLAPWPEMAAAARSRELGGDLPAAG